MTGRRSNLELRKYIWAEDRNLEVINVQLETRAMGIDEIFQSL